MKKVLHITLWIFLSSLSAMSQVINNDQCTGPNIGTGALFTLKTVGCVPLTVQVNKTDNESSNHKYLYDYRGGTPTNLAVEKSHTYSTPGAYRLMQVSFRKDNGQELRICAIITVLDTSKLELKPTICGNKVNLAITDIRKNGTLPYDFCYLDWGDGSIVDKINLPAGIVSHTYINQTDKKIRVRGGYIVDDCGGSNSISIKFPTATQPKIKEIEKLEKDKLSISFTNETGDDFNILSNNVLLASNKGELGLQKVIFSNTVKTACYSIQLVNTCFAKNVSQEVCDIDFQVTERVEGNELIWKKPTAQLIKDWIILKNTTNKISVDESPYLDNTVVCNESNCYQIRFISDESVFLSEKVCLKNTLISCNSGIPIFFPLAFSPNNDGINDVLEIKGELDKFISLTIVDHLGHTLKVINQSNDSWDGSNQPAGIYAYRLKTKAKNNKETEVFGRIILIK